MTPQLSDAIYRLTLDGLTAREISVRLDLPLAQVRRTIRETFTIAPDTIDSFFRTPQKSSRTPEWKRELVATLAQEGATYPQIAELTGISLGHVKWLVAVAGVVVPGPRYWTPEEDRYVVEHMHDPWEEVAAHLGRTKVAVQLRHHTLRHQGIPVYKQMKNGQRRTRRRKA